MLRKKVIVRPKIVLSVDEEKKVADVFMLFVAIDRRIGGQKKRSQKKKLQKSKNKKRGAYDTCKPLVDQIILPWPDKLSTFRSQILFFSY